MLEKEMKREEIQQLTLQLRPPSQLQPKLKKGHKGKKKRKKLDQLQLSQTQKKGVRERKVKMKTGIVLQKICPSLNKSQLKP